MKTLIVSDIHSNFAALKTIIRQEDPVDQVICLGDVVQGGPEPEKVLSLLSSHGGFFILGNHDQDMLNVLQGKTAWDTHMLKWLQDRGLQDIFDEWIEWESKQISESSYRFLRSFKDTLSINCQDLKIRLCHGHLWGHSLLPDAPSDRFEVLSNLYPEQYVFFGHFHVQFCKHFSSTIFINPGTVGGDYRLGHSDACYGVIEDGEIDLKSTPYPVDEYCEGMERVPINQNFNRAFQESYRKGQSLSAFQIKELTYLRQMGCR